MAPKAKKKTASNPTPADTKAATSTTTPAPKVHKGDTVHFHSDADRTLTEDSAHAARVLHLGDKKTGRADLRVYPPDGEHYLMRDVPFSQKRAAGAWSQQQAE